ncbi:MAG: hypothetical protein QW797_01080 [Thermoproteota archaeon]
MTVIADVKFRKIRQLAYGLILGNPEHRKSLGEPDQPLDEGAL